MGKKLTPIQKHSARVFIMSFFMIFFWFFVTLILNVILRFFLNLPIKITEGESSIGLFLAMYFMWKTNIRFGWTENFIEGKKKYPHLSAWFEKVTGR